MSANFENFQPKLRPGRVIPQGSKIIFETDNPFNQITLPMGLADMILLCSGQFTMREIIEKIYKKQGSVPFRSILQATHILHQGGFLENGNELILNPHLHSWMEHKPSRWNYNILLRQRMMVNWRSPMAYYGFTLLLLVGALLGLQLFPSTTLKTVQSWSIQGNVWIHLLKFWICSSVVLSARFVARGIQLLLLTGKVYNLSVRLSFWGVHFHVGDETSDLYENRLYTAMFHVSQTLFGWSIVFVLQAFLKNSWMDTLLVVNAALIFWELNPFINSEGLKLLHALFVPADQDIASWHFETNSVLRSLGDRSYKSDREFAQICALWGTLWLIVTAVILQQTAILFGPSVLRNIASVSWVALSSYMGLVVWLLAIYLMVQAFMETIVQSVLHTHWRQFKTKLNLVFNDTSNTFDMHGLVERIQNLPLFSHFHENNLQRVLENSSLLVFRKGTDIIFQGEPARELYVLLDGEVEIMRKSGMELEWITELSPTAIFGEAALLDESPRGAQVTAKTRVSVLKIPVNIVREIAEESRVVRHLDDFRNAILVNQFFASSPVFRSLSNSSIDFLCNRGALEYFERHQTVFKQGENGDSIYLILRGAIDIEVHGTHVKRMVQGNFFGEIALIANLPRTATVITAESSVLFRISADSFWEVLVQHIDLGIFIETVSEHRLIEDLKLAAPLKLTGTDS